VKVELGAPIIVDPTVDALWHLPTDAADHDATATVCGLDGHLYSYASSLRRRRLCFVCRKQTGYRPHLNPFTGRPA
jgi:hypothetical protein